ncbi:MAG: helix-turn-helix transcriptional regulator [Mycobacterium sp.]|nr:helix-turn-helix transcriptional regulator [Mycobacterium sp.]
MAATAETLARSAILGLTEELRAGEAVSVADVLVRLFPDTQLHFVDIDISNNAVAVATTGDVADPAYLRSLANVIEDHPLIRSHVPLTWSNVVPRRMSDVISQRELAKTRAYNELLRPAGVTHQLGIMTSIHGSRGTAWVMNRCGCDFSEREVCVAIALQPSLAVLQYVFDRQKIASRIGGYSESDNSYDLTVRELEVLSLVSDGLTAVRIAHVLNISLRTVHKHLEHAYGKLKAHDRLMAVTRARAAKLIT